MTGGFGVVDYPGGGFELSLFASESAEDRAFGTGGLGCCGLCRLGVSGERLFGEACDEALADTGRGLFDLGESHADGVGEWVVGIVGDEREQLIDDPIEVDGSGSGEGHGNLREIGNAFSDPPWAEL